MFIIKNKQEIKYMLKACSILKQINKELKKMIKPGMTGLILNNKAEEIIMKNNCKPNFKGLYGFPATICVSLNEVLVHGIPNNIPFVEGDIVSIDMGCSYKGYNSDSAFTVIVGKALKLEHINLLTVTKAALLKAISILKPGMHIGDISSTIQTYVEKKGLFLPIEFAGHGIGRSLHEEPIIPNVGIAGTGIILQSGMTICIEPMVQIGTKSIKILNDNWTPISSLNLYSAHFEDTILITDTGYKILT